MDSAAGTVALALMVLCACGSSAPPPSNVAVAPAVDLEPAWHIDERVEVFADRDRLLAFVQRDGGVRPIRLIDARDVGDVAVTPGADGRFELHPR